MQRVRVGVSRLRRYDGQTRFEVFGDLGGGTVDFDHPLTPRPVALWPEAAPRAGHLLDAHLVVRHLDSVDPDGHLDGVHLEAEHLWPALLVTYDTPGYVFGRFAHAVKMSDGSGNVSASSTAAVTINCSPTVPACVTRSGYEPVDDRLTFTFGPSRFEPISGK